MSAKYSLIGLFLAGSSVIGSACADSAGPVEATPHAPHAPPPAASIRSARAPNVVTEWAGIVQRAIHNANAPRPPASALILHTMAMLAMYDAAIAIEGGHQPFAAAIDAPRGADMRAAVATAAYLTAAERVAASEQPGLTAQYDAYLASIPDGTSKSDGIDVGRAATGALLALRAGDGFGAVVTYECSAVPPLTGEFEPNAGCGTQPVDAKVAQIRPFTFHDPARLRPDGPPRLASSEYAKDFAETRDYGRANSTLGRPIRREARPDDGLHAWRQRFRVGRQRLRRRTERAGPRRSRWRGIEHLRADALDDEQRVPFGFAVKAGCRIRTELASGHLRGEGRGLVGVQGAKGELCELAVPTQVVRERREGMVRTHLLRSCRADHEQPRIHVEVKEIVQPVYGILVAPLQIVDEQ
jgi:hypothetical protein